MSNFELVLTLYFQFLQAYKRLSILFEEEDISNFNFIPLSTSAIPRHITLDTNSLYKLILGERHIDNILDDAVKLQVWDRVFNLNKKEFKARSDGPKFTGMIKTDMVSISIVLGPPTSKGAAKSRKRPRNERAAGMLFTR